MEGKLEQSTPWRRVLVKLWNGFEYETIGTIMIPIRTNEPWTDAAEYMFTNISFEEADGDEEH